MVCLEFEHQRMVGKDESTELWWPPQKLNLFRLAYYWSTKFKFDTQA